MSKVSLCSRNNDQAMRLTILALRDWESMTRILLNGDE